MQASKVGFFKDSPMNPNNQKPLTRKQKRRIYEERVKELIRSKPAGTPLTVTQLINVSGYNPKSGYTSIMQMVKRRVISRDPIPGTKKYSWSIPGDAKVTAKVPRPEEFKDETKMRHPELVSFTTMEYKVLDQDFINSVEKLAREFSWKENTDSLRDFIKFLK